MELVNGYLYNVSSTSMVTPFTIILPVVTQDVYNVTGTTTDGDTITINHIPKTDTYNLSVGLNHTLVTAVVKPRPWEKYGISYSLRTALELIRVREESVELYGGVRVNTTPPRPALKSSETPRQQGSHLGPSTFRRGITPSRPSRTTAASP
ncbi:hypothetical protein [Thermococcus sp. JCM 11816]|uniref:hypothetical protein n=1 Tax=Thermococcus sp. (strain JCM 11816 / KS-1) TaxID=1295125 RepID=UPI0006D22503